MDKFILSNLLKFIDTKHLYYNQRRYKQITYIHKNKIIGGKIFMVLLLIVTAVLFIYLFYVLINPEKF